ncbi:hypothetical protein Cgig2_031179 [Carnegiea gigantea]|uniref:RING-CH-type domain-containing protein n=1 Tax=Carnegiea gigantea TaxID=171969 RepID=A0A9Q1KN31_9CARY|nr:hypothetical protein Cgig2_031179 [Carnegiea gigantea]
MDASGADDIIDNADENCALLNSEQPQCRICLDSEGEDLIAPCHCRGTQKYIHRSCLDNWRSAKEGFAFAHCTECRARFLLRANSPSNRRRSRLKFQLLVAGDHALIFIVVQLIVALFGMLLYKLYGEELREMFGYEDHPYGFYIIAVLAILLVGLLYGLLIAVICGQRINKRHYHVLAKQDLTKVGLIPWKSEYYANSLHFIDVTFFPPLAFTVTATVSHLCRYLTENIIMQEYIVEDREKNDVAELDPSHVSVLRMLGLY